MHLIFDKYCKLQIICCCIAYWINTYFCHAPCLQTFYIIQHIHKIINFPCCLHCSYIFLLFYLRRWSAESNWHSSLCCFDYYLPSVHLGNMAIIFVVFVRKSHSYYFCHLSTTYAKAQEKQKIKNKNTEKRISQKHSPQNNQIYHHCVFLSYIFLYVPLTFTISLSLSFIVYLSRG